MPISQIEQLLKDALELNELYVKGEGSHFQVIAVSAQFDGASRVKKQQMVYAPLSALIADGTVHALSIKAFTPEEWQRERKFLMPE
ncbi:BolA family transcriptional regulator [Bowmanella sp. Y26]|uniref:BolA family transcriptional regulator n=1 Tax=Bowmanella yangjiangensis TaxID=2811230 RepID=A0ABS3CVD6_9ALTE|nr:BolA family protein [Bowmanella yangjiangensis]MBN7821074.1 BolA family transcriptional regulator [Bowmanella yangjiangensis]MBT1062049.1 BolA family transcriptional regulator [Bowmanella yangjiangensis]